MRFLSQHRVLKQAQSAGQPFLTGTIWKCLAQWLLGSIFVAAAVFFSVETAQASSGKPSVSWVSPAAGSTVHGVFIVSGVASPDSAGTAFISKWCITVDGSPLDFDAANRNYPGMSNSNVLQSFSPDSNGCYSQDEGYSYSLVNGKLRFDSTSWTNGTHTLTVQVTDSNGKTSELQSLQILVSNPLPVIGTIIQSSTPDSVALSANWDDSSDGLITVNSCSWVLDGKALHVARCSDHLSSPSISLLNAGQHIAKVTLGFSNGDSGSADYSFTSSAFKLTAAHTKLTMKCPSNISGSFFKCSVSANNTVGVLGKLALVPQYKLGTTWFNLKSVNISIGSKVSISFPSQMPKTQTVRIMSALLGVKFYSQSTTYYPNSAPAGPSPTNILQRLRAKGNLPWRDYSASSSGFGPSPDYYYATTDPSGIACSVFVYVNPYSLSFDVNVGNFPTDSRAWESFVDKQSGYGIAVEHGSLYSSCSQVILKTFGR